MEILIATITSQTRAFSPTQTITTRTLHLDCDRCVPGPPICMETEMFCLEGKVTVFLNEISTKAQNLIN